MDLKSTIKNILSSLNLEISEYASFKALLSELYNLIDEGVESYRIDLEPSVYSLLKGKYKSIYPIDINNILFNIELMTNDEDSKVVEFIIQNKGEYIVSLVQSVEEDISESKSCEVTFKDNSTIWKLGREETNETGYYYKYEYEMYELDKNNKRVNRNFDKELDEDFSMFFDVPLNEARECRLNFEDNIEYVNKRKTLGCMKRLDNLYSGKEVLFGEVFSINDLDGYFVDLEVDEEELDNIDMDALDSAINKLDSIKSKLTGVIGNNGEFIMTQNLSMNISHYIESEEDILNTSGFIIRKLNNIYTLFYINITDSNIVHMKVNKNIEELKELYYSHEFNSEIFGVKEFFGIDKDKGYSLNK